jgi:hypothetical protein
LIEYNFQERTSLATGIQAKRSSHRFPSASRSCQSFFGLPRLQFCSICFATISLLPSSTVIYSSFFFHGTAHRPTKTDPTPVHPAMPFSIFDLLAFYSHFHAFSFLFDSFS